MSVSPTLLHSLVLSCLPAPLFLFCVSWTHLLLAVPSDRLTVPDRDSFLYGLLSGLLPVVALAVLTALVPIVIRMVAVK